MITDTSSLLHRIKVVHLFVAQLVSVHVINRRDCRIWYFDLGCQWELAFSGGLDGASSKGQIGGACESINHHLLVRRALMSLADSLWGKSERCMPLKWGFIFWSLLNATQCVISWSAIALRQLHLYRLEKLLAMKEALPWLKGSEECVCLCVRLHFLRFL